MNAPAFRKELERAWAWKDHIDKTLAALGQAPTESKRLLRQVSATLAEAEGMAIGAETIDDVPIRATTSSLAKRTNEIRNLL